MAGVHALRGTNLPRDRRTGADAVAPDALAEPGATTATQDRPHPRQLYVLHDEPLTPFEAMQLDADYLAPRQSLGHSAKAVQVVGLCTPPGDRGRPDVVRTHLCRRGCKCFAERLADQGITATASYPQEDAIPRFRRRARQPSSGINAFGIRQGRNPRQTALFLNPNGFVQYVVVVLMKAVLPRRRRALGDLQWPKRFAELRRNSNAGAKDGVAAGGPSLRQAVLENGQHGAAKPASAIPQGICSASSSAMRGEFNAWAKQTSPAAPTPSAARAPPPEPPRRSSRGPGSIERVRDLLRKWPGAQGQQGR